MSALQLAQIKKFLSERYVPHLNLSGATQEHHQLSRAVAALAVANRTGLPPETAAAAVTDDTADGGIDAAAYAADRGTLILAQSKWTESGSGLAQGDVLKFLDGVKHLVVNDWSAFGGPLLNRKTEISSLIAQPGTRIELVLATTGPDALAAPQQRAVAEFTADMNDTSEIATFIYLEQSRIYEWIAAPQRERPDLPVTLRNWGSYQEGPYTSYYGTASAQDVVSWYSSRGSQLFSSNIRVGLEGSDVNDGIVNTASEDAARFWFFNNGITVVARAFEHAPTVNQKVGAFTFKQASVVNGAQTVTSLARAAGASRDVISQADVFIRFVTVEDPDGDFARLVTRRTNTQNRVSAREFVSQDPQQGRISTEFAIEGHEYVFRTGSSVSDPTRGCDLTEATIALACAYRIDEAVLAKREIGSLWEDIKTTPYTALFNSTTSGAQVWDSVLLSRFVEEELVRVRDADFDGRDWLVLRHGNRMMNWAVAQRLGTGRLKKVTTFHGAFSRDEVAAAVEHISPILVQVISDLYSDSYPLPLFRNVTKCRDVGTRITVAG